MPHSLKNKVKSLCYKGEITENERDRLIQALEQTPPKGKWVEDEDCLDGINFPDVRFYCSECKAMAYRKSVYCPNCGADMRGDRER